MSKAFPWSHCYTRNFLPNEGSLMPQYFTGWTKETRRGNGNPSCVLQGFQMELTRRVIPCCIVRILEQCGWDSEILEFLSGMFFVWESAKSVHTPVLSNFPNIPIKTSQRKGRGFFILPSVYENCSGRSRLYHN